MKKINFLLQIFAVLYLFTANIDATAQTIYDPAKTNPFQIGEKCDCSRNYQFLSEHCKKVCDNIKIQASEIVIHGNITVGNGQSSRQ